MSEGAALGLTSKAVSRAAPKTDPLGLWQPGGGRRAGPFSGGRTTGQPASPTGQPVVADQPVAADAVRDPSEVRDRTHLLQLLRQYPGRAFHGLVKITDAMEEDNGPDIYTRILGWGIKNVVWFFVGTVVGCQGPED